MYDPTLVSSHEPAQSMAGANARIVASDGGNELLSASCEEGETQCALPHAQAVCVAGRCLIVSCHEPFADCDEQTANGCEADLTSPQHCGRCLTTCRFGHAHAQCRDGQCSLGECDPSYDDCDGDPGNGCEHKVDSLNDCGACGRRCEKPSHGTAACEQAACGIARCDSGWGDCNDDASDGCEQPLSDTWHCGSCQTPCDPPHAVQSECQNGLCVVRACAQGYADCNGDPADGCEADLAGSESCGACGAACDLPHTTDTRCVRGEGQPYCSVDRSCGDDGDVRQSECAQDTRLGCARGYADCDGMPSNGCETDLSRLSSCGACNASCVQAHASTACRDGRCVRLRCDPGYGACDERDECRSLLDDPDNCGACGNACDSATERCIGGRCTTSQCDAGQADCDRDASNGCETSLTDPGSCGGCDARCEPTSHARPACRDGACAIERCDAGFEDCDADPRNGCEVDLGSVDDCGACGGLCAFAHARARCNAGSCELDACDDGYADCNGEPGDGCETDLRLPDNCGACGNGCRALPDVAGSTCQAAGCAIQCQSGRGDCDAASRNGCEADLSDVETCGSCSTNCTQLPHVSAAACSEGACSALVCDAGYADCNSDPDDGCERAINTTSDCGACDQPCATAHAQSDCSDQRCTIATCDAGFGDCDSDPSNGCETLLNDSDHCGACGNVCPEGAGCENGACGCVDEAQCPDGLSCCDGRCVSALGSCFPFPCIPGTALPDNALRCGGCGELCLGWCCGELL